MDQKTWFKKQVDAYNSLDEAEFQNVRFDLVNDIWQHIYSGAIDSVWVPDFHNKSSAMGKPICISDENNIDYQNFYVLLFIKQAFQGGLDPRILAIQRPNSMESHYCF